MAPPVATQNDVLGYAFALLVAAGGTMGYVKKGSTASMISGVVSGLAIAYGAYLASLNPRNVLPATIINALLALFMGRRFLASGKFMPGGLITTLALGMAVRYGLRLR